MSKFFYTPCLHGIPLDIVLDQGPQFVSWVWNAFYRANQGLEIALRCYYHQPLVLELILPGPNTPISLTSAATGLSPFEASLGYLSPVSFPGEWTCCILSSRTALLHSLTTISASLAATGSSIQTRSGSLTFFQNYTIKNWIQKALSPLHWPICRWSHHKSFCCQTKVIRTENPSNLPCVSCLIISILSMKVN